MDNLILNEEHFFFVNEFVIIELIHQLIKKKGYEGFKLAKKLISGDYPFITIVFDILHKIDLENILILLVNHGMQSTIGGRDASILHSMEIHEIHDLITNDKGFTKIEKIMVNNPIFL
jgi:predicted nucleic acid-binding protein